MIASGTKTPTTVTHVDGKKFNIAIRSHTILVDQTYRGGGDDAGPSPIELLGASLGSCIAHYVREFCETRGISYEGMRVEVSHHSAHNPSRIQDFAVKVILPGDLPEQTRLLLDRVIHACPVHNTLAMGAGTEVVFESLDPALAGT
jgi:uncharacterized OsmC-like protein